MVDARLEGGEAVKFVASCLSACVIALALALLAVPGEGADQALRELRGFNAIDVGGGVDLVVRQGETFRVEVDASNGESDDVLTGVEGSTLKIGRRSRSGDLSGWFAGYSVSVTLPELVSLVASAGSDVASEGVLAGGHLSIRASGGSDLVLQARVAELDVQASGGSDTRLSGTADILHTRASGGSDLDARGLQAREAHLATSGGSDSDVTVSETLVVDASGGSDVIYRGDPGIVDINAGHGADVVHR